MDFDNSKLSTTTHQMAGTTGDMGTLPLLLRPPPPSIDGTNRRYQPERRGLRRRDQWQSLTSQVSLRNSRECLEDMGYLRISNQRTPYTSYWFTPRIQWGRIKLWAHYKWSVVRNAKLCTLVKLNARRRLHLVNIDRAQQHQKSPNIYTQKAPTIPSCWRTQKNISREQMVRQRRERGNLHQSL